MSRTNDFGALDSPPGEFRAVMRANVLHGEIFLAAACDGDEAMAHRNGTGLTVLECRGEPGVYPVHIIPVCNRASSDIIV